MKPKTMNFIWGIVLIAAGILFLAQNLGWIPEWGAQIWMLLFLGASALFFVAYFVNGLREWGWLFPAVIFSGVALTIYLGEAGVIGELVALPVLLSVAIPFLVAFLLDRKENWWALIPSWVMLVVAGIVFFANRLQGEYLAALILVSIGLPFLVVFLLDRSRWWALIPAFALGAVGLIPVLATGARGEYIAAYVMFAVALPFLVVYAASRQNWWALIPAGIMLSIGVMMVLIGLQLPFFANAGATSGIMLLGFALTFGWLWLLRGSQQTGWAKYPAIGLAVAAVGAAIFGASSQLLWALGLILAGMLLLYFNLRGRKDASG